MNTPLPTAVLAVIAALRCQALPWGTIAERMQLDETQLRLQLATQRDEFQAQMELAKSDLAEELLFAGLAKLQQLLHCGKQNIENDAAKSLLRFHQNVHRPTKATKTPKDKPTAPTPANTHTDTPAPTPAPTPNPMPTKQETLPNGLRELLNFEPLPQRIPTLAQPPLHRTG